MRYILALLIIRLCLSQISKQYEALNISCINSSYLVPMANNSPLYVSLPTFYRGTLQVDLRHLSSNQAMAGVSLTVFINNTDTSNSYTENVPMNISVNAFNLFAANNLVVNAYFTINGTTDEEVIGKSYLFSQSVSFAIVQANPQGKAQSSFLFLVTNTDLVSLPYNMISSSNVNNFDGYFISKVSPLKSLFSRQSSVPSYSDYWNGLQSVALPYVPYLSNCQNQGDYLYFSQLIHNSTYCNLYGDSAVPINEFSFGSTAQADTCHFTTKCVYDQIPSATNQYPFWSTLATQDSVLFSVTATQQSEDNLLEGFTETDLVPCKIKKSSGTNYSDTYPLKISMNFGYYQQSSTQRRMITCEIEFSLYTTSKANFTYELGINIYPLSHTLILLSYGFNWYIYMLVFIIIGLISNCEFLIFWCYHLIVTIKQKRNFNLRIYLRLEREIVKGVIPAGIISVFITFIVEIIMNGTFFGQNLFTNFSSFWNYLILNDIGYFATNIQSSTQSGRMGVSNVIISSYLMIVLSDYLIGKERKKQQYQTYEVLGRKLKPQQWNRGKLLFVTFIYIFFSIYFLYFTYTTLFGLKIWFIIAFMQAFQMVIQEVIYSIFDDKLPCTPLKLTLGVLAYLATMGAIDLYYFILGYLVDVGISIIEITYLSQLQEGVKSFIEQKNQEINKFYTNLLNDEDDEQENKSKGEETVSKNDEILINEELNEVNFLQKEVEESHNFVDPGQIKIYDEDEQIKKKFLEYMMQNQKFQKQQHKNKGSIFLVNEQVELQKKQFENKKFELIIDGATGMMQYLIQPIIIVVLWITYNTSTILSNFQISYQNAILYLLSSVILALFFQINIIIIFHVLELYLNTDYDYQFKSLLQKFQNKSTFWITDEEQFDTQLQIKLRGIHSYGISSQLYFVVALYTISIYLFINGVITIISSGFNPFQDPYIILIFPFWIVILQFLNWLLKKIAHLFDIWGYASLSEDRRSETKIEEVYSQFQQETNEMLKKEELINSSTIKFTFKKINDSAEKQNEEFQEEKKKILQSKLATICKRLEPEFDNQDFKLNFARKNKDFIRQNIQKILPLVKSFPSDDTAWIGKGSVVDHKDMKKENKNCDPIISDFLANNWMKRVEANRTKRQEEGIEHERKLKRCRFCFKSWGLYYGYDGICLECSENLFKFEEPKKHK